MYIQTIQGVKKDREIPLVLKKRGEYQRSCHQGQSRLHFHSNLVAEFREKV
jgi:hypothetical protein